VYRHKKEILNGAYSKIRPEEIAPIQGASTGCPAFDKNVGNPTPTFGTKKAEINLSATARNRINKDFKRLNGASMIAVNSRPPFIVNGNFPKKLSDFFTNRPPLYPV
jgi:hypothetical protein